MKGFFAIIPLLFVLCIPAMADFAPETDYMGLMMEAVCAGDAAAGAEAEALRNEKIGVLGLDEVKISFRELDLLSRLIESEAGSLWLSPEWKMAVGEVALNRLASPEFPDSLEAVITQPGQYRGAEWGYIFSPPPSMASVEAAKALLEGERILSDPSVVFQANFPQGSSVHTELYDPLLGSTYFCCSNYPDLYWEE